ncbi:hypothetical protein PG989_013279 [Apiospora arundinis]
MTILWETPIYCVYFVGGLFFSEGQLQSKRTICFGHHHNAYLEGTTNRDQGVANACFRRGSCDISSRVPVVGPVGYSPREDPGGQGATALKAALELLSVSAELSVGEAPAVDLETCRLSTVGVVDDVRAAAVVDPALHHCGQRSTIHGNPGH